MKKRNILRRILAVVLVLTMATGLTAQAKGDASSTSLKEAQKEKAALEKQLKAAKELINDLKDSKGDVEDKVQELNNELVDISSKITSLENQLADKSTEIADAEAELADKQKQYDDMKTRIQYMYENSQTTYLEQLLESNSVAEFLNTAEYIAEIQKYDRQKLDEYTENIEYITVAKEQLEQDYADLENMKANVESQKQSVAALMSQKETELAGITSLSLIHI